MSSLMENESFYGKTTLDLEQKKSCYAMYSTIENFNGEFIVGIFL